MSAVSLPVTRLEGRAIVVANAASRSRLIESLTRLGYQCAESDDPYSAVGNLTRSRETATSLILSLACLFREELTLIATVRKRFPLVEVWLAHTDGRQAALAEAIRLGAAGLVDDEGLHRMAPAPQNQPDQPIYQPLPSIAPPEPAAAKNEPAPPIDSSSFDSAGMGEPVLTAEELRALLQEQPVLPPSRGSGRDA